MSEFEWQFDADSYKDAYHCAGAFCAGNGGYRSSRSYCGDAIPPSAGTPRDCIGWVRSENTGFYYVTVSGYFVQCARAALACARPRPGSECSG